ncbi:uncharacterized protein I303_104023 [Kwoniella dejecticola CBS 10117]|uniref:Histone H2A n=1 Tax=Kwoniella dejecticola CBS 10117 TaxID=1296121 RepID=A0AAJ8KNR2_9TREE
MPTEYVRQGCGTKKSIRSGLTFPVTRVRRHFVKKEYAHRVDWSAAVYLAAVLEYLVCELVELAGTAASELGKKRITPRHVQLAVKGDEELDKLLQKVFIAEGGVRPFIHETLMPKDDKSKSNRRESTQSTMTQTEIEESGPGEQITHYFLLRECKTVSH